MSWLNSVISRYSRWRVNESEALTKTLDFLDKTRGFHHEDFGLQAEIIALAKEALIENPYRAALAICNKIAELYPTEFTFSDCILCTKTRWDIEYFGTKVLPAKLYSGGNFFPFYVREVLPLVYGSCVKCGIGRIRPAPALKYIDQSLTEVDGDGVWMEDLKYHQQKRTYFAKHYDKSNLKEFKSEKSSVLELSCGAGTVLELFAQDFGWRDCVGLEPDKVAFSAACRKSGIVVERDLIYHSKFVERFDLVVMDNSLEHHSKPFEALCQIYRALRPGGAVFIIVPNYHAWTVEKFGIQHFNLNWGHWHYFTAQSLYHVLKKVGFNFKSAYIDTQDDSLWEFGICQEIETELTEKSLRKAGPRKKLGRGEFIYFVATKDGS